MLHIEEERIRELLLKGNFGLEKESLRVLGNGRFSHTPHPFPDDENIVKDFCENQTEINTGVHDSAQGAVDELVFHNRRIFEKLGSLPEREYLWPFSNPPYIENEEDVPIAVYDRSRVAKMVYREYLSDKYGRYKMTFSGIHVNYSFSDELLRADYEYTDKSISFEAYKDRLYLDLAQMMCAYGWILVAVTAASPVMDGSYVLKGARGRDVFLGMASVRCSELGYWNSFSPVFDFTDLKTYAQSIRKYVQQGFLRAPSELYYPIRLKPRGENNLHSLETYGISHMELRMFDLNPLREECVEVKDILFAQLLMVWLASRPQQSFAEKDQVQATQNYKNAAHYDLKTVKIMTPAGETFSVADAALNVLRMMREFYHEVGIDVDGILNFEHEKFIDPSARYAWKIREDYETDFAGKGLKLAKERQEKDV